jgi:hypothetical protein
VSERIVQTTWTDGGRHQPLPPPEDTQGDEIERLTARIAELEAQQEKLIARLVDKCLRPYYDDWSMGHATYDTLAEIEAAIRAAIETPGSGERREGDK